MKKNLFAIIKFAINPVITVLPMIIVIALIFGVDYLSGSQMIKANVFVKSMYLYAMISAFMFVGVNFILSKDYIEYHVENNQITKELFRSEISPIYYRILTIITAILTWCILEVNYSNDISTWKIIIGSVIIAVVITTSAMGITGVILLMLMFTMVHNQVHFDHFVIAMVIYLITYFITIKILKLRYPNVEYINFETGLRKKNKKSSQYHVGLFLYKNNTSGYKIIIGYDELQMSDYLPIIKSIIINPSPYLLAIMLVWIGFWVWIYHKNRSDYHIPKSKINQPKKIIYNIVKYIALITSLIIPLQAQIPQDSISRVIDLSPSISEKRANIDKINYIYRSAYSHTDTNNITLSVGIPYDYCKNCHKDALSELSVDQSIFTGELYGSALGDALLFAYDSDNDMKIIGITDSGTNKGLVVDQAISHIGTDRVLIINIDSDLGSINDKISGYLDMVDLNNILWPIWAGAHLILLSLYILTIGKHKRSYDTL